MKKPALPAIKAALIALLWISPAAAQDSATWAETLKKQKMRLETLLTGHFANKEQAAFSEALTKPGDAAFDVVYSLTVAPDGDALSVVSTNGALVPAMTWTAAIKDQSLHIESDGPCRGAASAFLDGFVIDFDKACPLAEATILPQGIYLAATEDRPALHMTRASHYSCWVTMPRKDGSGWFFKAGVPLHDQGGEVWIDTDEKAPQRIGLKMRQAVWPYGISRESLVLYVHKPENPDKAASYTWANPGADRIGLNLRWMQASCTRKD